MDRKFNFFDEFDPLSHDINSTEECRVYLDDLINEDRGSIWSNSFLLEFFSVDLHFLSCKKMIGSIDDSMRSSKLRIDL